MESSRRLTPQDARSRRGQRDNALEAPAPPRAHDPDRTRQDILDVATEEFASAGFSGARVDRIAERTRTSKRMIYYYFGSKEGLYLAALEKVYGELRAAEMSLDAAPESPADAFDVSSN
jgi:AcrR family transcriptional regulator